MSPRGGGGGPIPGGGAWGSRGWPTLGVHSTGWVPWGACPVQAPLPVSTVSPTREGEGFEPGLHRSFPGLRTPPPASGRTSFPQWQSQRKGGRFQPGAECHTVQNCSKFDQRLAFWQLFGQMNLKKGPEGKITLWGPEHPWTWRWVRNPWQNPPSSQGRARVTTRGLQCLQGKQTPRPRLLTQH